MMLYSYIDSSTSLELRDIIEDPVSVVWTERWDSYGECRIVVPASEASKVAIGRVLTLEGRRMACEVVSLLIKDGLATAEGVDALGWLDRRIIDGTVRRDGYVEGFIKELVDSVDYDSSPSSRRLPVFMGPSAGIATTASLQRSWRKIGEVATELARQYGFGVTATLERVGTTTYRLRIDCAERTDDGLTLSREIGNLSSERILDDVKKEITQVYIGGGDYRGGGRAVVELFSIYRTGLDRREAFLDRRDIPTWEYYPEVVAEWGQPYGCAEATGQYWEFGNPRLYAICVQEGAGFVIQRTYARIPMLFQNNLVVCAAVVSEDLAEILPDMDALIKASYSPTQAETKSWTLT